MQKQKAIVGHQAAEHALHLIRCAQGRSGVFPSVVWSRVECGRACDAHR